LHICQFKTMFNGVLICAKYGHRITTDGCPSCPARPYPSSNQSFYKKPVPNNK